MIARTEQIQTFQTRLIIFSSYQKTELLGCCTKFEDTRRSFKDTQRYTIAFN